MTASGANVKRPTNLSFRGKRRKKRISNGKSNQHRKDLAIKYPLVQGETRRKTFRLIEEKG